MQSLTKEDLRRQLQQIGIKVESDYVKKNDVMQIIANSTSDFMKDIPNKSHSALTKVGQQYEMLCHTLGSIRHHVEGEESSSAQWIKSTIDDLAKRLKAMT